MRDVAIAELANMVISSKNFFQILEFNYFINFVFGQNTQPQSTHSHKSCTVPGTAHVAAAAAAGAGVEGVHAVCSLICTVWSWTV